MFRNILCSGSDINTARIAASLKTSNPKATIAQTIQTNQNHQRITYTLWVKNFPPGFAMVWKDHSLSSKGDLVPIGTEYSIQISIIGALTNIPPQAFMGWNKPTLAALACASQKMFYLPS